MAKGFNLTAEINLRGPSNIRTVAADIRRQLGSVSAVIKPTLSSSSVKTMATEIRRQLAGANITVGLRADPSAVKSMVNDIRKQLNNISTSVTIKPNTSSINAAKSKIRQGLGNVQVPINVTASSSSINALRSDIRKRLNNINTTINIRIPSGANQAIATYNGNLTRLNNLLTQVSANASNAAASISALTGALNGAAAVNISNINTNIGNISGGANRSARSINMATSEIENFGRQAGLAIRRFAAYSSVAGIIYGISSAVRSAVSEFIEYDKQLTRIAQVTGDAKSNLGDITNTISSLSTSLGVSSSALATTTVTLAQAGLSAKETERALKALALSALAPSFDDLNQTVEGSIALMRQFSIGTGQLEDALGSINAVAAKFAVEASDIITAIQRTGGVFAAAGRGVSEGTQSLNEFIAVFTSIRATTRESAETIATGLRTIFTRIQRADTIDALKEFGVTLTDLEGKFVGPYIAVQRLAEGLGRLDPRDLKFSQIVEELGGFRQIGKVLPLIQQFTTAQEALKVAQSGQGSLSEDAAKGQQALAVQIQKVRQEFLALVRSIGNTDTFHNMVKVGLDLASALIKVADAAKGLVPLLGLFAAIKGVQFGTQFLGGFARGFRSTGNTRGAREGGPIGRYAVGGMVDVALMPGETVVYPEQVSRIGVGKLRQLNHADRNGIARKQKGGSIGKFAGGGYAQVPGTGRTDSYYTQLPEGSFVIRTDATKALGGPRGVMKAAGYKTGGNVLRRKSVSPSIMMANAGETPYVVPPNDGPPQASHVTFRINFSDAQRKAYASQPTGKGYRSTKFKEEDILSKDRDFHGKIPFLLSLPRNVNQNARMAAGKGVDRPSLQRWITTHPEDLFKDSRGRTVSQSNLAKNVSVETFARQFASGITADGPPRGAVRDNDLARSFTKAKKLLDQQYVKQQEQKRDLFLRTRERGVRHEGADVSLFKRGKGKATGGFIQRFAEGSSDIVRRNVGYIDNDEIADLLRDPVKGPPIKAEMDRLGIKGVAEYKEHLSNFAASRRQSGQLGRLSNVVGVAASGKSTEAQGGRRAQEADNARLRKTTRYPILTEADIIRSNQVVDTTSVAGPTQAYALRSADRIKILSSRTKKSQEVIKGNRQQRAITGKNLFGRKPDSTHSAPLDSGPAEAYIAATEVSGVDPKKVATYAVGENFSRTRVSQPTVRSPERTLLYMGNFGPTTAGHVKAAESASRKTGISPQDSVMLVSGDASIDIKNPTDQQTRTAVFPQTSQTGASRLGMAQATFGSRGFNVAATPRGTAPGAIPSVFKIGDDSYIVPRGKNDVALVGDEKDDKVLGKYKTANYSPLSTPRIGGISGTAARDAIMRNDVAAMKKLLTPEGFQYVQQHLSGLQRRPQLLESILAKFAQNSASGRGIAGRLTSITEELSKLPARKTKTTPPEVVSQMEALRKQRDTLTAKIGRRPSAMLRRLESMSRRSIGGIVQHFEGGGIAEELKTMGRAGLMSLAKARGIPFDANILDPRKKLSPADQARRQSFLQALTEAGVLQQNKDADISRIAQSRSVAVVGVTGDRSRTEIVTPGAKDKDTGASVRGVPITLETGALPPRVARRVQALIRNRVERIVADVGRELSMAAGLGKNKRSRADIRRITSKDLEDIVGSIFEKGLGAANIQYDEKAQSMDFPKGLRPELASIMGVSSGVMTDVTNAATKDTAKRKVREGQIDRGRLEERRRFGRSPFAEGGEIPIMAQAGEFIINRKSAKSIGYANLHALNKYHTGGIVGGRQALAVGGAVQKFFFGGRSGPAARPDTISVDTIGVSGETTQALRQLAEVLTQLGVSSSQSAQLLQRGYQATAAEAQRAYQADLIMAQAAGASAETMYDLRAALQQAQNQARAEVDIMQQLANVSGGQLQAALNEVERELQALTNVARANERMAGGTDDEIEARVRAGAADRQRQAYENVGTRAVGGAAPGGLGLTLGPDATGDDLGRVIQGLMRDAQTLEQANEEYIRARRNETADLTADAERARRIRQGLDHEMENILRAEITARNNAIKDSAVTAGARDTGERNRNRSGQLMSAAFGLQMLGSFAAQGINAESSSSNAQLSAGIQGGTNMLATGTMIAGGAMDLLPERMQGFGLALGVAGTAVAALGQAFIDARNAAIEFEKKTQMKNTEMALEQASTLFEKLNKDIKNIDIQKSLLAKLNEAGEAAKNSVEAQDKLAKAFWVNLFDAMGSTDQSAASKRSEILDKKGILAYLDTTELFGSGESGTRREYSSLIPQKANENSKTFASTASQTLSLVETKIKSGSSMEDVLNDPGIQRQKEVIARSNAAVEQQIMRINNSNLAEAEKAAAIKDLINAEAESAIRTRVATAAREKAMKELDSATTIYTRSLERMFQNMEQSIGRASYEMNQMSTTIELVSDALKGQAKVGSVSLQSINTLQNPRAYSSREVGASASMASAMFGSRSSEMTSLINIGEKLEQTVMSSVNNAVQKNPNISDEALGSQISRDVKSALEKLALPPDLTAKLSKEVGDTLKDLKKEGDDKVDYTKLSEKLAQLNKVVDSAKRAQEVALKALEHYQNALNMYSQNINKIIDLQVEANQKLRRSTEILVNSELSLTKALGRNTTIGDTKNIVNNKVGSMTGGTINPDDIFNNISQLENQRQIQQTSANAAAERGLAGVSDFTKFSRAIGDTSVQLRENIDALKYLADNTDIAAAAMDKIQAAQQKAAGRVSYIEKLVTSTPEELDSLNAAFSRLQNNMNGQVNSIANSQSAQKAFNEALDNGASQFEAMRAAQAAFANDRKESLGALNDILPLLGSGAQAGGIKANVLESMLKESGVGVSPVFQQILNTLRNPESDPETQAAIAEYRAGNQLQAQANSLLAKLDTNLAQDIANRSGKALADALRNVVLKFDNMELRDIRDNVQQINLKMPPAGAPGVPVAGKASGGIIYAAMGQSIDFAPKGTDTVPAMLTPGEFVVNRAATQANLPLLNSINSGKYSNGGRVKYYSSGGIVSSEFVDKYIGKTSDDLRVSRSEYIDPEKKEDILYGYAGPRGAVRKQKSDVYTAKKIDNVLSTDGDLYFGSSPRIIRAKYGNTTTARNAQQLFDYEAVKTVEPYDLSRPDMIIPRFDRKQIKFDEFNEYKRKIENKYRDIDINDILPDPPVASLDDVPKAAMINNSIFNPNVRSPNHIGFLISPNKTLGRVVPDAPSLDEQGVLKLYIKNSTNFFDGDDPEFNYPTVISTKNNIEKYRKKRNTNDSLISSVNFVDTFNKFATGGRFVYNRNDIEKELGLQLENRKLLDNTNKFINNPINALDFTNEDVELAALRETLYSLYKGGSTSENIPNASKFFDIAKIKGGTSLSSLRSLHILGDKYNKIISDEFRQYPQAKTKLLEDNKDIAIGSVGFDPKIFPDWANGNIIVISDNGAGRKSFPWIANASPSVLSGYDEEERTQLDKNIKDYNIFSETKNSPGEYGMTLPVIGKVKIPYNMSYTRYRGPLAGEGPTGTDIRGFALENGTDKVLLPNKNDTVFLITPNKGDTSNPYAKIYDNQQYYMPVLNKELTGDDIFDKTSIDLTKDPDFQKLFDPNLLNADKEKILEKIKNTEYTKIFPSRARSSGLPKQTFPGYEIFDFAGAKDISYKFKIGDYLSNIGQDLLNKKIDQAASAAGKISDMANGGNTIGDAVLEPALKKMAKASLNIFGRRKFVPRDLLSNITRVPNLFSKRSMGNAVKDAAAYISGIYNQIGGQISALETDASGPMLDQLKENKLMISGAVSAFSGLSNGNTRMIKSFTDDADYENLFRSLGAGEIFRTVSNRAVSEDYKANLKNTLKGSKIKTAGADGLLSYKDAASDIPDNYQKLLELALNPYNEFTNKGIRAGIIDKLISDISSIPRVDENGRRMLSTPLFDRKTQGFFVQNMSDLKAWYSGINGWVGQDYFFDKTIEKDNKKRIDEFFRSLAQDGFDPYTKGNLANRNLGVQDKYGKLPDIMWFSNRAAAGFDTENKIANDPNAVKDPQVAAQRFQTGGMVYAANGQMINFQPRGTDTVPAMLTPGEFVVNRAATQANLPLLQAINESKGGSIPGYATGGQVSYMQGGGVTGPGIDLNSLVNLAAILFNAQQQQQKMPESKPDQDKKPAETQPKTPAPKSSREKQNLMSQRGFENVKDSLTSNLLPYTSGEQGKKKLQALAAVGYGVKKIKIDENLAMPKISSTAKGLKYRGTYFGDTLTLNKASIPTGLGWHELAHAIQVSSGKISATIASGLLNEFLKNKDSGYPALEKENKPYYNVDKLLKAPVEIFATIVQYMSTPWFKNSGLAQNVLSAYMEAYGFNNGGVVYASTGKLIDPQYASVGKMVNFAPRGTDTVPAMLTPGEFVVNRAATQANLPLLQAINNSKGGNIEGYATGGVVYAADGGLMNTINRNTDRRYKAIQKDDKLKNKWYVVTRPLSTIFGNRDRMIKKDDALDATEYGSGDGVVIGFPKFENMPHLRIDTDNDKIADTDFITKKDFIGKGIELGLDRQGIVQDDKKSIYRGGLFNIGKDDVRDQKLWTIEAKSQDRAREEATKNANLPGFFGTDYDVISVKKAYEADRKAQKTNADKILEELMYQFTQRPDLFKADTYNLKPFDQVKADEKVDGWSRGAPLPIPAGAPVPGPGGAGGPVGPGGGANPLGGAIAALGAMGMAAIVTQAQNEYLAASARHDYLTQVSNNTSNALKILRKQKSKYKRGLENREQGDPPAPGGLPADVDAGGNITNLSTILALNNEWSNQEKKYIHSMWSLDEKGAYKGHLEGIPLALSRKSIDPRWVMSVSAPNQAYYIDTAIPPKYEKQGGVIYAEDGIEIPSQSKAPRIDKSNFDRYFEEFKKSYLYDRNAPDIKPDAEEWITKNKPAIKEPRLSALVQHFEEMHKQTDTADSRMKEWFDKGGYNPDPTKEILSGVSPNDLKIWSKYYDEFEQSEYFQPGAIYIRRDADLWARENKPGMDGNALEKLYAVFEQIYFKKYPKLAKQRETDKQLGINVGTLEQTGRQTIAKDKFGVPVAVTEKEPGKFRGGSLTEPLPTTAKQEQEYRQQQIKDRYTFRDASGEEAIAATVLGVTKAGIVKFRQIDSKTGNPYSRKNKAGENTDVVRTMHFNDLDKASQSKVYTSMTNVLPGEPLYESKDGKGIIFDFPDERSDPEKQRRAGNKGPFYYPWPIFTRDLGIVSGDIVGIKRELDKAGINSSGYDNYGIAPLPRSRVSNKQLKEAGAAGYAVGGIVYAANGTLVPYQPRGTDTVPAMLTPGEFVVNRAAAQANLPLLHAINESKGGPINTYAKGGLIYLASGGGADDVTTRVKSDGYSKSAPGGLVDLYGGYGEAEPVGWFGKLFGADSMDRFRKQNNERIAALTPDEGKSAEEDLDALKTAYTQLIEKKTIDGNKYSLDTFMKDVKATRVQLGTEKDGAFKAISQRAAVSSLSMRLESYEGYDYRPADRQLPADWGTYGGQLRQKAEAEMKSNPQFKQDVDQGGFATPEAAQADREQTAASAAKVSKEVEDFSKKDVFTRNFDVGAGAQTVVEQVQAVASAPSVLNQTIERGLGIKPTDKLGRPLSEADMAARQRDMDAFNKGLSNVGAGIEYARTDLPGGAQVLGTLESASDAVVGAARTVAGTAGVGVGMGLHIAGSAMDPNGAFSNIEMPENPQTPYQRFVNDLIVGSTVEAARGGSQMVKAGASLGQTWGDVRADGMRILGSQGVGGYDRYKYGTQVYGETKQNAEDVYNATTDYKMQQADAQGVGTAVRVLDTGSALAADFALSGKLLDAALGGGRALMSRVRGRGLEKSITNYEDMVRAATDERWAVPPSDYKGPVLDPMQESARGFRRRQAREAHRAQVVKENEPARLLEEIEAVRNNVRMNKAAQTPRNPTLDTPPMESTLNPVMEQSLESAILESVTNRPTGATAPSPGNGIFDGSTVDDVLSQHKALQEMDRINGALAESGRFPGPGSDVMSSMSGSGFKIVDISGSKGNPLANIDDVNAMLQQSSKSPTKQMITPSQAEMSGYALEQSLRSLDRAMLEGVSTNPGHMATPKMRGNPLRAPLREHWKDALGKAYNEVAEAAVEKGDLDTLILMRSLLPGNSRELSRILLKMGLKDDIARKLTKTELKKISTFLKDHDDPTKTLKDWIEARNARGYYTGGVVYASAGQLINFQPKGTDTIPAMLTPGEFVVNRAAAQANLPLLQSMNSGASSYSRGGVVYLSEGTSDRMSGRRWRELKDRGDKGDYKAAAEAAAESQRRRDEARTASRASYQERKQAEQGRLDVLAGRRQELRDTYQGEMLRRRDDYQGEMTRRQRAWKRRQTEAIPYEEAYAREQRENPNRHEMAAAQQQQQMGGGGQVQAAGVPQIDQRVYHATQQASQAAFDPSNYGNANKQFVILGTLLTGLNQVYVQHGTIMQGLIAVHVQYGTVMQKLVQEMSKIQAPTASAGMGISLGGLTGAGTAGTTGGSPLDQLQKLIQMSGMGLGGVGTPTVGNDQQTGSEYEELSRQYQSTPGIAGPTGGGAINLSDMLKSAGGLLGGGTSGEASSSPINLGAILSQISTLTGGAISPIGISTPGTAPTVPNAQPGTGTIDIANIGQTITQVTALFGNTSSALTTATQAISAFAAVIGSLTTQPNSQGANGVPNSNGGGTDFASTIAGFTEAINKLVGMNTNFTMTGNHTVTVEFGASASILNGKDTEIKEWVAGQIATAIGNLKNDLKGNIDGLS